MAVFKCSSAYLVGSSTPGWGNQVKETVDLLDQNREGLYQVSAVVQTNAAATEEYCHHCSIDQKNS